MGSPFDKLRHAFQPVQHAVHQLCDALWGIVPSEVRVYERLQAVVGEQGQIRWYGENVMQRVVKYIGHRGWLEKRLRP